MQITTSHVALTTIAQWVTAACFMLCNVLLHIQVATTYHQHCSGVYPLPKPWRTYMP